MNLAALRRWGQVQTPVLAVAALLALFTALAVTKTAIPVAHISVPLRAAVAVAALAVVVIAITLGPVAVFLAWLVLAPFMQETIRTSALGHAVSQLLNSGPPLIFLFWIVTHRNKKARASLVDFVPALYLGLVLTSAIVIGTLVSLTQQTLTGSQVAVTGIYSIIGIGVIGYYFCAFVDLGPSFEEQFARAFIGITTIVGGLVVIGRVLGVTGTLAGFDFGNTYSSAATTGPAAEGRATGPLGGPGALGTFLGAGFVVALAVLAWNGPRTLRRLSIAAAVLLPPAILLTLTRAPVLATAAVSLVILLTRSRSRWPTVVAVAFAAVALVAAWGSIGSTSLYKNRVANTENIQGRALIDRWSLELAARKPIIGWGYGTFDHDKNTANLSSGSLPRAWGIQYTSHNTFLTVLVELGAVGLLLMITPFLVAGIGGIRRALQPSPGRWALVGLVGILGVWVISAGTYDMRFFSFLSAIAWIAAGLLRRARFNDQPVPPAGTSAS